MTLLVMDRRAPAAVVALDVPRSLAHQLVVALPRTLRCIREARLVKDAVFPRVPLVKHRRSIRDPRRAQPRGLGATHEIGVERSPPQHVFVVAASLDDETSA